ncbi:hypothetical protein KP509_35G030700 [Ceratopteris richardii]|uniref:Uncharacterized protein n=1 Tax=Ceratopteris richardii TaxID=49495 RepID=A0A8T2QEC6_CERRI|nr:hypothetical protein KP509_35G030700 [Ceratopteris richardii]
MSLLHAQLANVHLGSQQSPSQPLSATDARAHTSTHTGISTSMAKPCTGGGLTALVYGYIRDSMHDEAIRVLEEQLLSFPGSQAALSLLGYCHYHLSDFYAAASAYEKLVELHPMEQKYRIYLAQSFYKASMLDAAGKACSMVDEQYGGVGNLKACIQYAQDNISGSKQIWEETSEENIDAAINLGCCLYKEEAYELAFEKLMDGSTLLEFQADLAYNKALCLYSMKQHNQALKILSELIENGIHEYPELSVGRQMEGMEICSVGNSQALNSSKLVEAFNLKAAIEYATGNFEAAKLALKDMPPRNEEELDSVTLHNQALFYMDVDPASGFRKLNFLIQNPPFPPESYRNLLLLYCKPSHKFTELATMLMEDNEELTKKFVPQDLQEYLNAIIVGQTSIVESYQRLSELAIQYGESMRRLIKLMQDTHLSENMEAHRKSLIEYNSLLENYVPVIMAMAKIFWDKGNYVQVDRIFQQSTDFCMEHPIWRLNVAHNLFMQDNLYDEAIQYYEPIVKKSGDNILNAPAIVLANLCVSYIMTSRNEEAEDLMRKIEKEEERAQYEDQGKQCLNLCIVNLVIGTLYCAKQNFEFGISRIIKSLDPISKKMDSETWFYAKRCFLALADNLAKQMIMLRDGTYVDIDEFLDMVDLNAKKMPAHSMDFDRSPKTDSGIQKLTIAQEARLLKRILLKCRE